MPRSAVPKKRPPAAAGGSRPGKPGARRQYNVGLMPAVAERVEAVAAALGLDPTSLLRMIVHENLAEYEERARSATAPKP
jgi:hypothetical protein